MGVGYLENNFLTELGEYDADGATSPLSPAPGEPAHPPEDLFSLPGGIVIPKKTFYTIIAVIVAIALYFYMKSKAAKKVEDEES